MAYTEMVCQKCGNLRSECSNPDIDWHPHTDVCYAIATREWGGRVLAEKHKGDEPGAGELGWSDGLSVYVTQSPPLGVDEFDLSNGGHLVNEGDAADEV